jgi:hypothetical protein
MPRTIAHAQQRLVMVRMLIDFMRIVHKHYAPADEPLGRAWKPSQWAVAWLWAP